jgi:HK97 family phage portal protein
MRLRRRREPLPAADNAVPPTFTSFGDFLGHALRNRADGWFESLVGYRGEQVGTVDRCLQLNSQQIASMPLRYRHSEATSADRPAWVSDPDPAWYPNGIHDAIFAAIWSIYAQGEAFLYVTSRYADGYPLTWTLLDPVTMKVEDEGGMRWYQSNGHPLDPGDVIQVMRDPTGALRGRSSLDAYWSNVSSAAAADSYAADVYYSTGVNRMALKSSRRLDAEQAAAIQAQWVAAVSKRLGAPAIIPPDLELLQALTISPKDMMLLESRDWDARQIAAAFGVPAILLNIPVSGSLVYQNPAMLADLWWRAELMPTAVKLQEALSRWLPRGHWVEFDPSASIRPDLSTLVTIYSKALADGAVTADEYRAAVFDLPPLREGDQAADYYEEAGTHGSIGSSPTALDAALPEEVLTP